MASYRKILLCYDGSREGRKALRDGANLALDLKAETHVLAVVDMRSSIAQSAGLLTDMACGRFEDAARDILREGVEWLTERGVPAQGHFAFGHPIDEIAGLAQSLQVDLVVVGHRCRTGLARWWMGAGNTPLMDRVSCSILVAVSPTGTSAEQEDAAHAAMPVKAGKLVSIHVGLNELGQPLANRRQMIPARVVWVDRPESMATRTVMAGIEFLASISAKLDAA